MSGAWGSGSWGAGSWGGGPGLGGGDLAFLDAQPIRENVVRVEFSEKIYLSNLLDAADAGIVSKWQVSPVSGSIGMSGDPARSVRVVGVEFSDEDEGVAEEDYGRFVNLVLDRPMTPFPAEYDVYWADIFSASLASALDGNARLFSAYRIIDPPQVERGRPSRDFANPQTVAEARAQLSDVASALALGTFGIGDDGDYATDEGRPSLKKRVLRRLMTIKGAFAHLPNYGVGVPAEAKRLGISAVISRLAGDAESQILEEPDVAKCRVIPIVNPDIPGLVIFRVLVRQKEGPSLQFDFPFSRT